MSEDWHDAQVIEATLPNGARTFTTRTGWRGWLVSGGIVFNDELSDVRVIVDRDGRVAPDMDALANAWDDGWESRPNAKYPGGCAPTGNPYRRGEQ